MPRRETSTAVMDRPAPAIPIHPPATPLSPAEAPSRDVDGAVLAAVRDRARALEAAERLFEKQVAGVTLEPDEGELLRYLFPSEFDRARELSRVARLRKFQRQAGTEAERKAARVARDEAAQKLAGEGSMIREQVEALQRELVALERSAAETAAVVERQSTAVAALHDPAFLPEPHRSRYEAGRQAWERDWGIPARSARLHAKALQELAGLDPADDDARRRIHDYCQREARTAGITGSRILERPSSPFVQIKNPGNPLQIKITVNGAAWTAHAAELREKAQALLAEAERLETAGASAKAAIDGMLVGLIPA